MLDGKRSNGLVYDFKLHLLINHVGEIISLKIIPSNANDRTPISELCKNLYGKLSEAHMDLVTTVRKMCNSEPRLALCLQP